jgi:hypothetical protein
MALTNRLEFSHVHSYASRGWLDRIRFGLVDRDQTLYLAEYDFSPR